MRFRLSFSALPALLAGLLLIGSFDAAAQGRGEQGRIVGTVTDTDSGETLPGVNVVVQGTTQGASTDFDGNYIIVGLRPGAYNVQATSVGYESKLFTGIQVEAGEDTRLDIDLAEAVLSTGEEIVVVGEKPLVDVEESASSFTVTREQIEAAPVTEIQEIVANQTGVVRDPTGLYIRGGRADETGFLIDGVSAKDPLSGTGFGVDLGSNAFAEVEVTTGGVGADVGDVTSGVVAVTTRDGTNSFAGSFSTKRDNLGFNDSWESTYNESLYELAFSGPILRDKLFFFTSGQAQVSDNFTRQTATADQLQSSIVGSDVFTPYNDNRWSGLLKLTYLPKPGMKAQGAYSRSLTVNQNTRMLQVTGNDTDIAPGFQYIFSQQPDNANTYAADNTLAYLRWTHVLNETSFYEVQGSRLFTRLRADANGRDWRPDNVETEFDPESIVEYPVDVFVDPVTGQPVDPSVLFVLPGPGLYNNGGLATRWHDHFAEELTLRGTYTRFFSNQAYRLSAGFETKLNDYQWIDVIRPWVGAPITLADGSTTTSNRLGESSDIWRVKPRRTALFVQNQFRYRGLIANIGLRAEAWAPGKYVDDLVARVNDPDDDGVFTIPASVARAYEDETFGLLGLRWKARLLPKLRVSFPVRENQVLFFNYGHSTRQPHPTYVYTNLDPFYQDRSFFSDLGNPNLNPEVDISYEIGVRNQLTQNDALSVTAFWRDKFDFVTAQELRINDATGRETRRAFRVNGDFARIRGLEVSYIKRVGRVLTGQLNASYSRATGLSSTNNDALAAILANDPTLDTTVETPLAWDRPLDVKAIFTANYDQERPLFGVAGLNRFRAYLATTFRSGRRYTPVTFEGRQRNPITGELDGRPIYIQSSDPTERYSEIGDAWWWWDLSLERKFGIMGNDLAVSLEVSNLFNQQNSVVINPVTGKAYPDVSPEYVAENAADLRGDGDYDVPTYLRDPRYEDPTTTGLPPFNPARFLPQRHILLGLSYEF
jgi:outer membrane receptor protein involved in Fe transport